MTEIVVDGVKTALYPLYMTNTSTALLFVEFKDPATGKIKRSNPGIKPGGQKDIFTGTMADLDNVVEQLRRQGYIERSETSNLLLPRNGGEFRAAAHCFYTIGQPENIDAISQVVEKNESIAADSVQTNTNAKAAAISRQSDKRTKLTSMIIEEVTA